MLFRRALALAALFCLLTGLTAVPCEPILVCRITGTPMTPVTVPKSGPGLGDTCCTITVAADAGKDAPRFALSAPGCCELRQDRSRAADPAITTDSPETGTVALLPAVPSLPVPRYVMVTAGSIPPRESAPRAPAAPFCIAPRSPGFFLSFAAFRHFSPLFATCFQEKL